VTGAVQAGVTMMLSGTGSATTTTDASGSYSFTGLSNGTYTVTPSKSGYTFMPVSREVTVSGADVSGVNITATAVTYSISGTVTGAVQAGVTMMLSGAGSATTTTDSLGNYTFTGLSNGTYTVTPGKSGYSFSPSSILVKIVSADQRDINFTANVVTYSISGAVVHKGSGLSGVTVTLSGNTSGSLTTDVSGNYTFTGLSNGTYTVTPSKSGYIFTPSSREITISSTDVSNMNFVAVVATYSISGTVIGAVQSDVNMTLSGAGSGTTTTDASGNYAFNGLENGTYVVTPGKSEYTFTPGSREVTVAGVDISGVDFVSSVSSCTIWSDVITTYNAYVIGEAIWSDVIECYNEYASP
jgi:inhibitor of cysteine peptidase